MPVPLQRPVDCWQGGQTGDEFLDDLSMQTRQPPAVQAVEHAKTLLVSELG